MLKNRLEKLDKKRCNESVVNDIVNTSNQLTELEKKRKRVIRIMKK